MSDSVWPQRWQPTRHPWPWDSPGKNTGVGCHFLPQCMKAKSEREAGKSVQLLATPWAIAYQAPLSMGFSRQEYWSGLPSASVRSIPLLPFTVLIFAWNVPLVSLILLKRSLVFPILLFSFIPLHWSLRKAFLCLLAILWDSAFKWVYLSFSPLPLVSLLFSAICKASSDNHFAFLHFFFLGEGLDHCLLYNVMSLCP